MSYMGCLPMKSTSLKGINSHAKIVVVIADDPIKEITIEKFDYKVLWNKRHGVREDWFDGDENIGPEITTDLLSRYGEEGWATLQMVVGPTHKVMRQRVSV